MKKQHAFGLLALSVCFFSANANAETWKIGQEKEVSPGLYMKLLSTTDGWTIWRNESKYGVSCQAFKGTNNEEYYPFKGMFFGPENGIRLTHQPGRNLQWNFMHSAAYPGVSAEYRYIGDKFFTETVGGKFTSEMMAALLEEFKKNESKTIELHTERWEYPSISYGLESASGKMALKGINRAINELSACVSG